MTVIRPISDAVAIETKRDPNEQPFVVSKLALFGEKADVLVSLLRARYGSRFPSDSGLFRCLFSPVKMLSTIIRRPNCVLKYLA